jgi:ComF family protein
VWSEVFGGLLDLLAPRRCPGCDLDLPPGETGFCGACAPLLERLTDARGSQAAYAYGGPLADAICRFKYGGRTDLAEPLGRLLVSACTPFAGRVDAVVPIPLHPRRLHERGFDQVALLAAPVARALGVPLDLGSLRRVRDTASQAALATARERADNVRGCFVARVRPERPRILVLDDVRTTGATLAEAAGALTAAGACEVWLMALAGAEH